MLFKGGTRWPPYGSAGHGFISESPAATDPSKALHLRPLLAARTEPRLNRSQVGPHAEGSQEN